MSAHPPAPRRPAILDIEASGFGAASYPIEVGVVRGDGQRYCALIAPRAEWTHWDESAAALHGITRAQLHEHGRAVGDVARTLNDLLAGQTVYSDGWVVDQPWLRQLFHAAAVEQAFRLSPLESILDEVQMTRWQAAKDAVLALSGAARHRASNDAWVIQETWYRTRSVPAA